MFQHLHTNVRWYSTYFGSYLSQMLMAFAQIWMIWKLFLTMVMTTVRILEPVTIWEPCDRSGPWPLQTLFKRQSVVYRVFHLLWDKAVPPCSLGAQPPLPNSHQPKLNWADNRTPNPGLGPDEKPCMYLRKRLNSISILRRSSSLDATPASARKLPWTWREEAPGWSWLARTWTGPVPLQTI